MEYDRSLYRVYERVMEDLNGSSSISANRPSQQEDESLLPYCLPLSLVDFIERHCHARSFQYFSVSQRTRLSDSNSNSFSENAFEHNSENHYGNANPLYSHHTRRMQIRMGEHRRALLVNNINNDQSSNSNANRGPNDNQISDIENGTGRANNSNSNDSDRSHSSAASSSDDSDSGSSYDSNSTSRSTLLAEINNTMNAIETENEDRERRLRQRMRRERRMRRRQARMNEPIEETLRRIRNRRPGHSSTSPDDDEDSESPPGCTQKNLYGAMQFSMWFGIFHIFVLATLHSTYVGAGVWKQGIQWGKYFHKGTSSKILPKTCLEYALQTRPASKRSSYGEANNEAYVNMTMFQKQQRRPLLGVDEILQIKIIYGGDCTGQCSRVRTVIPSNNNTSINNSTTSNKNSTIVSNLIPDSAITAKKNGASDVTSHDYYSSPEYWETPHYRYSSMEALMYLDKEFTLDHNLTVVNITVTERCLSSGNDNKEPTIVTKMAEFFSQAYGMDTAMINQLMYGIRQLPPLKIDKDKDNKGQTKQKTKQNAEKEVDKDPKMSYRDGFVQNLETLERWNWSQDMLELADSRNPLLWFFDKFGIVFVSFLSFFLVTSVTSLIVRVLTGSGVVLMFPLFYLFRLFGISGADDRILGLSYPWIGHPRAAIQQQNFHPSSHLIWAHLAKIMLYYVMYEACQAAWSSVLYGKSIPEAMPIWIFGMAMFWEYFTMVFVRSALSVFFFPRIALIYYTFFHIYFYSIPYGYFNIALIPLFFFMLQAMLYTILALELPAASRGVVNMECPREVYNRLSWPEWTGSLPIEWTLFLPLNSRYIPLHDRVIDTERVSDDDDEDSDSEEDPGETGEENRDDGRIMSSFDREEPMVEPVDIESVTISPSRSGLHARRTGGAGSGNENENVSGSNAYNIV